MSAQPEIATVLEAGETVLWQGWPQPGRRLPVRAIALASLFFVVALLLLALAWYLEIWWGHVAHWHLAVFGVIGTAAFFTFLALRVSLLDRRRARARDAHTAYAITNRRALVLAGPYRAEVPLMPGVTVSQTGDSITIHGKQARLRFERLDDAGAARDILCARIEGEA